MPVLTGDQFRIMVGPMYVEVRRTWFERLFTRPWQPLKTTKRVLSPKWEPMFKDIQIFDDSFIDKLVNRRMTGVLSYRT